MKKFTTLKTLLVGLLALGATSAWADDITSLPANYDYTVDDASIVPFDAGQILKGTNVQALTISNTTATAWFDSDESVEDRQPYSVASNEKVTITIDSYHGWLSGGKTATVTVYAPNGISLASYSYNAGSCNLSDVKIGGVTVSGFSAVNYQNQNGLVANNRNPFVASNNPQTTISISGSGYVEMSFKKGSSLVATYSAQLSESSIQLEKIEVIDGSNNTDRTYHIGKLSIASETVSEATITYKFEDTDGNTIKENSSAPGEIGDAIAGIIPAGYKVSFYNEDQTKKYIYDSYECSDETVPSDGTTVTLKFHEASKYSYTITSSYEGNALPFTKSGEVWEDEPSVTINHPRFQLFETLLVEKAPDNNNLTTSINVSKDGYTADIEYSGTSVEDVCLLSEAEDLGTTLNKSATSFTSRISNGQIIYGESTSLFTLEPGNYKLTLGVIGGASNKIATYVVNAGEEEILNGDCQGNFLSLLQSKAFSLTSPTEITVTLGNSSSDRGIDLVYVQDLGTLYNYTIKLTSEDGKINKEIESGTEKADAVKTAVYNRYINIDGTLYEANANEEGQYIASFTIDEDNKVCEIIYAPTSIKNIILYSEGEDIEGAGIVSAGEIYTWASGKKGAAGEDVKVTELGAGNYKIVARFGGKAGQTFKVNVGGEDVINIENTTGALSVYQANLYLNEASTVKFSGGYVTTSNNAYGLDYIYIQELPNEIELSISNAGYATYCSPYDLDFSASTGLTAYIAKADGNEISFTPITSVPANTGVLLKGKEGKYKATVAASNTDVSDNELIGVTKKTKVGAGIFVLMDTPYVGFFTTTDEFTVGANTAYLPAISSEARIVLPGNEATAIKAIETEQSGEIYNLAGQRVKSAQKGLYIIGGKKVIK